MRLPRRLARRLFGLAAAALVGSADAAPAPARNVILFVADGLRSASVTPQTAPVMAALRRRGVDFRNSHSLYPTFTTANASALATGHGLGDTGDFANVLYFGFPLTALKGAEVAFLEDDPVLAELARHYGGSYLNEETVLSAASAAGYATASIGKLGPVAIQAMGDGGATVVVDDRTGGAKGAPLDPGIRDAIVQAGLVFPTPDRGANDKSGDAKTPGTHVANIVQGPWFAHVASRVLLPRFQRSGRPFAMVFWSRDPDGSQHNEGDSLGAVVPGINGATSRAGIREADDALGELLAALKALGLDKTTDVVVTADHGFSTVSRESRTSPAARGAYPDVAPGELPPGFLALDLSTALGLPLADDAGRPIDAAASRHPGGGARLGDPADPAAVIAANGGSDLIWLPKAEGRAALARKVVAALWAQDYTAAVFVDDALGPVDGALPMSAVGLVGASLTPRPAIVVSFRSFTTGCAKPELCAAEVADTALQQGQGMHGALSRADTHNFMAAVGPDFRSGFVDPTPTSNADLARTLFHLLRLAPKEAGTLRGRVLTEGLKGGAPVAFARRVVRSTVGPSGLAEALVEQSVGEERYYDAAGAPGRAVGAP